MNDDRVPVEPEDGDGAEDHEVEAERLTRDDAHRARIERGRELTGEDDERVRKDGLGGLIPYHNKKALIGYYAAVFSLIPCFPIGLFAAYYGYQGLQAYKARPAIGGHVHAWIGIVVGGGFGLLWLSFLLLPIVSAMFS